MIASVNVLFRDMSQIMGCRVRLVLPDTGAVYDVWEIFTSFHAGRGFSTFSIHGGNRRMVSVCVSGFAGWTRLRKPDTVAIMPFLYYRQFLML